MGYSRHAVSGMSWNGLLKVISTGVAFGKIYLLSRLLIPQDFGLFSLVAIALGIIEALTETGINTTILQSRKSISYFIDTAWVISILRGLIISILMILLGLFMQSFYQEPRLLMLVGLASFIPLIKGFINPAIVSLYKDLNFFSDTMYRLSLVVVDAVAAVAFALAFRSVYAFIWAMIVAAVFEVVVSFLFFKDKPQFLYLKSRANEILQNAKGLNASAVLSYAVSNMDNVILGKVVGTSSLGVYANGYAFSHRVTFEFAKSVQHGMLPVFVRIQDEKHRLFRAFLKSAAITMIGLSVLSVPFLVYPQIILLLLPAEKWGSVVGILPLLFIASLVQSFVSVASPVFISTKKYVWLNLNLLLTLLFMVLFIWPLSTQFGLLGGAWGLVLARVLALPIIFYGLWQSFQK